MSAVADKLDEARALIERGWTKGVFARRADGRPTYAEDRKATCFCAVGALYHVGAPATALRLLERTVRSRKVFAEWNDAPERTQAEVIDAFKRAAELARAGEQ